ncbi:MAG TPA: SAF domain-containing protein [Trichormus sp.]|jgi:flagella basal body P-ring formation protein FlgA
MAEKQNTLVAAGKYVLGPLFLMASVSAIIYGIFWGVQFCAGSNGSVPVLKQPIAISKVPQQCVVAREYISPGKFISSDQVKLAHKVVSSTPDPLSKLSDVVGYPAKYPLSVDQIIGAHEIERTFPWRFRLGVCLIGLALLAATVSYIWLIGSAFQNENVWAIVCVVFPIAVPSYAFVHWDLAKKPFVMLVSSMLLAAVGFGLESPFASDPAPPTAIGVSVVEPIRPGETIPRGSVKEQTIPQGQLPTDALASVDEAIGHRARNNLSKDRVLAEEDIAGVTKPNPPWVKNLVGHYLGELETTEGKKSGVLTDFSIDARGQFSGAYKADEGDGPYHGQLFQIGAASDREVRFFWMDRYGTGTAHLEFADDYKSFTGHYFVLGQAIGQWSGKRVSADTPLPPPSKTKVQE